MKMVSQRNVLVWGLLVVFSSVTGILLADMATQEFVRLVRQSATASSVLKDPERPDSYYGPDKAVDRDIKTAWCADAKGNAIRGQTLSIEFAPIAATHIAIFPGVGASGALYLANNRISKANVSVLDTAGKTRVFPANFSGDECYNYRDPASANVAKGQDPCQFSDYGGGGVLRADFHTPVCVRRVEITILEVKRGSGYDDTCISEVALAKPPNGNPDFEDFAKGCR